MAKKKNEKKDIEKNKSQSTGIITELKKVTWPNAEELSKATAAVIFLVVTVALIIFASDSIFSLGTQKIREQIVKKQTTVQQEVKAEEPKKEEVKPEEQKTEENKPEEVKPQ